MPQDSVALETGRRTQISDTFYFGGFPLGPMSLSVCLFFFFFFLRNKNTRLKSTMLSVTKKPGQEMDSPFWPSNDISVN